MGFKKVIDRQRAIPGKYSITPVTTGQEIIQDIPSNVNVEGTRIDADLLNPLQKGLIFEFDSVNSIESGKDIYSIEVPGLISNSAPNDYPLQNGMTFQIKINTTSTQDQTVMRINNDIYDLAKNSQSGIIALEKGDMVEGMYYHITYNGTLFIVENFSLPARDNTAGLITLEEIKKIGSETLGLEYKAKFGSTLTSIEKDKIYYYFDTVKNTYVPYKALKNANNASGFLAPDTTNFVNISNDYINNRFDYQNAIVHASAFATGYLNLSKKSNIALLDLNNIKMTTGAVGTPIAYVSIRPTVRVFFNMTSQGYTTLRMAIDVDGKVYNLDENKNLSFAFSGQAIIF